MISGSAQMSDQKAHDQATALLSPIAFHQPHTAPQQSAYLSECLATGRLRSGGHFSKLAQQHLTKMYNCNRVILTHSCTAAMEIMALALNLTPSDEVIVPSFTFTATATAFARTGARLVLADIDPQSMMITEETIRGLITPKTKAIVVVHYGGFCANIEPIQSLCDEFNIVLLEDAAQGVGASRNGTLAGGFGLMGALSFHETKIAHCGQGGALIINSNDSQLLNQIDAIVNRGTNFSAFAAGKVSHYEWTHIASSFEMTELQASILTAQLEDISANICHRQEIYKFYSKCFAGPEHEIIKGDDEACNGHFFAMLLGSDSQVEALINFAAKNGIALQSHYMPLHLSDYGKQYLAKDQKCEDASKAWRKLVRLPIHTSMGIEDAARVAKCVTEYLQN